MIESSSYSFRIFLIFEAGSVFPIEICGVKFLVLEFKPLSAVESEYSFSILIMAESSMRASDPALSSSSSTMGINLEASMRVERVGWIAI